jgi:hypothetical protein
VNVDATLTSNADANAGGRLSGLGIRGSDLGSSSIVVSGFSRTILRAGKCDRLHSVYGILATATHEELGRLYTHARDVLGETYLPEAVLAETFEGKWRAALCYVAPEMTPRPAALDYVTRIVEAARRFGFPQWYIERLESFRP